MGILSQLSNMKKKIIDKSREEIDEWKADQAALKISKKKARAEGRRETEKALLKKARVEAREKVNKKSGGNPLRQVAQRIKSNRDERVKKQGNNLPPMFQ